ncbi:MAG: sarcosine oxidase subunit gamma [Paracoccaceae bacterium]
MSDAVSALNGASYDGFVKIREIGPVGMISLRAKPGTKGLDKAIKAAVGVKIPEQRQMEWAKDRGCGWMSPDEFLLVLPYAQVGTAMAAIAKALAGEHHLAADVSDARAVFRIEGPKAGDVLAKLCPADLAIMGPNELRRTRAAQVAAAFWRDDQGYTLVSFRSVGAYVMGLLSHSAMAGSELG